VDVLHGGAIARLSIYRVKVTCSVRMEPVMVKKVRVTEAKAQPSALMARAVYAGERCLIERRGKPLAALVGVEDLERLEAEGGSPRWKPRGTLALVLGGHPGLAQKPRGPGRRRSRC